MTAHAHNITADRATVRQHVEIIHQQATRAFEGVEDPGYLQLVLIHPASETAVTQRFRIGDVEGMETAALQASANGHNVYVEGRTVKRTTKGRGKFEDTRGVFSLVTDSDADKGMASRVQVLPSLAVETSPGNAHHWFFITPAIGADEAKATGDAIRAATGADSDTGVITQPYRVAGTPNFPGPKKVARGRTVTPTKIVQHLGTRWTADELRDVFPAKPKREAGSKGEKAAGSGHNPFTRARVEPEVVKRGEHRSRQFYKAVHAAIAAGMTPDELEELMREHPDGCASKFLEDGDRLRREIDRAWPGAEQEQAEAAAEAEDDLGRVDGLG